MANPAAALVKIHLTMSLPRAMTSAWAVRGNEEGQHGVYFLYHRFVLPGVRPARSAASTLARSAAAVPQTVIIPPVWPPMAVRHPG
jgi:hypothetical protein